MTQSVTNSAPALAPEQITIDPNNVTPEQRVTILRFVHGFFSNFDRVPGAIASQWGSHLDALALVANNLATDLAPKD